MIVQWWTDTTSGTAFSALDTELGTDQVLGVPDIPPGAWEVGLVNDSLGIYKLFTDEASGNQFLDYIGAAPLSGSSAGIVDVSGSAFVLAMTAGWGIIAIADGGEDYPGAFIAYRVTVPAVGGISSNQYLVPSWVGTALADASALFDIIQCTSGTRLILQNGTNVHISAPLVSASSDWISVASVAIPDIEEPANNDEYLLRGCELARAIIDVVRGLGDEVIRMPFLELGSGRAVYSFPPYQSLVVGNDLFVAESREVRDPVTDDQVDTEFLSKRISVQDGVASVVEQRQYSLLALTGEVLLGRSWLFATDFSVAPSNFWTGFQLAAEVV